MPKSWIDAGNCTEKRPALGRISSYTPTRSPSAIRKPIQFNLAVATCFSARAEVVTNDLVNAAGTVIGYEITGLGTAGDEVALVFTDTSEDGHTWQVPAGVTSFEYLVVAGGGGGGAGWYSNQQSGGGGAGGYLSGNVTDLEPGTDVEIIVGIGGASRTNGGDSSLSIGDILYEAIGGGAGGSPKYQAAGYDGGSGGGGGHSSKSGGDGVSGQGNDGGKSSSSSFGGGGGGAGSVGGDGTSSRGGNGGSGLENDITGEPVWYAAGGGGGNKEGNYKTVGVGGSGIGGAGANGTKGTKGGNATGWGSGGGGGCSASGGSGYQGIVVVRYTAVKGLVLVPEITSKVYNGERQYSGLVDTDDYTVVDEGGVEGGEHPVVLTLKDSSKQWDMENSVNPLTLYFEITPAENEWINSNPTVSLPGWVYNADEVGVITPATTKYGDVSVVVSSNNVEVTNLSIENLSNWGPGEYVVTFTAPESCLSYSAVSGDQSKSVSFTVYDPNAVPEYTFTVGDMSVGTDGALKIPYTLDCGVDTDFKATIMADYAIEGSDTTNTVALATEKALDSNGTLSIENPKPEEKYYVSLYVIVNDEQQYEATTPVIVAIPGAATELTASATFTNNPMEFTISGSVVPGIGTTVVTVRWSLNNADTFENTQTFEFLCGQDGAFSVDVPYTSLTDKLTYDVSVANTITAGDHGSFEWSDGFDAVTKTRLDSSSITYTWTGDGGDNLWTNINNWSASKSPCFGYPDSSYATVQVTKSCEIDLNGGTFTVADDVDALIFGKYKGVIKFTNGTIDNSSSLEIGAAGTKVIFDSVNFTSYQHFRVNNGTKTSFADLVFTGNCNVKGGYRPWGTQYATFSVLDGVLSCKGHDQGYRSDIYNVTISNAWWEIERLPRGLAAETAYFYDGADRQARIVSEGAFRLSDVYDIEIPAEGHTEATIETETCDSTTFSSTFRLNVTNYKSGKPVPLVKCTSSTDQNLSLEKIKLVAYVVEDGENVTVTANRNAKLVWSSEDNTLYFQQDSQMGFSITIR